MCLTFALATLDMFGRNAPNLRLKVDFRPSREGELAATNCRQQKQHNRMRQSFETGRGLRILEQCLEFFVGEAALAGLFLPARPVKQLYGRGFDQAAMHAKLEHLPNL